MKKLIRLVLFILFLVSESHAIYTQGIPLRRINQNSFKPGERLTFSIGWEFINAGTAVLSVEDMITFSGRPCYKFSAVTASNAFFSTMYKVRDTLVSIADAEGLYPVRYTKAANEGDYKRHFSVDFDHVNRKASISDADSGQSVISIPLFVQDIISCFYYMRTQEVKAGQKYVIPVFDNGKFKDITIEAVRKENVEVEAGSFNCIVVKTPIGPFKNKSDLFIWLTDDHRKIPVLMKSKIVIGSVRAELEKYSGTY